MAIEFVGDDDEVFWGVVHDIGIAVGDALMPWSPDGEHGEGEGKVSEALAALALIVGALLQHVLPDDRAATYASFRAGVEESLEGLGDSKELH